MALIDRRMLFARFVCVMSLWAVHLFVVQCPAAANSPGFNRPTVKRIIAAWRAREERIRSAKVVWVQDRVDKKGSVNVRFSKKLKAPFPAKDTEYSNTETLQLADGKWRLDFTGFIWDLDRGAMTELKYSSVGAGGVNRRYNETGSGELFGHIASEQRVHDLRTNHIWPIVWFLRPFQYENRVLFFGSEDDLKVLRWENKVTPETKGLVVCGSRHIDALRLWLDAAREFLVVRVELGKTLLNIEYTDHPDYGPVPREWSTVKMSLGSEERRVITCRVTECKLNLRIPPSVFELRFPSGTRVVDEQNRDLIVDASGRLVPALPMDAQGISRSWRPWLILLNGVVVMCVLATILYRRSARRKVV